MVGEFVGGGVYLYFFVVVDVFGYLDFDVGVEFGWFGVFGGVGVFYFWCGVDYC